MVTLRITFTFTTLFSNPLHRWLQKNCGLIKILLFIFTV